MRRGVTVAGATYRLQFSDQPPRGLDGQPVMVLIDQRRWVIQVHRWQRLEETVLAIVQACALLSNQAASCLSRN